MFCLLFFQSNSCLFGFFGQVPFEAKIKFYPVVWGIGVGCIKERTKSWLIIRVVISNERRFRLYEIEQVVYTKIQVVIVFDQFADLNLMN